MTVAVKTAIRRILGVMGWQIYRARGGIFLCPVLRAARPDGAPAAAGATRLHLGCGNVRLDGYLNVDVCPSPAVDLVADIVNLPMFADASLEEIRMSAVLEHLYRYQRAAALREWHRLLRPGGTLRIDHLPDFAFIARAYVERKPGVLRPTFDLDEVYRYTHGDPVPWNAEEQLHKDLFTRESVACELEAAGFQGVEVVNAPYRNEVHALSLNAVARKPAATAAGPVTPGDASGTG